MKSVFKLVASGTYNDNDYAEDIIKLVSGETDEEIIKKLIDFIKETFPKKKYYFRVDCYETGVDDLWGKYENALLDKKEIETIFDEIGEKYD